MRRLSSTQLECLFDGVNGWEVIWKLEPDTIFLTPKQKRTLLEKITMPERDAARLERWMK